MAYEANSGYLNINPPGQVPRTALMRKIKTQCAGRHIYITAPGGYGKTVAAAQWLTTVRGNKAKLILGSADNVPGFFYKRLAAALLKITQKEGQIEDAAISFDRLLEIIKRLPAKGKRCYLVVDDIHMIKNEEIAGRMPVLLRRMPGYIRCCMISRREPSSVFGKSKQLGIITKEDLAFSPDEIEWLANERGIELNSYQIGILHEKTGGWVMYLLALLSGGSIPYDKTAGGPPQGFTQYIQSQVWEHIAQDTQKILLSLAVPDEITPDLCRQLTGCENGASLLRRICKDENTFLSPTGTDKHTYAFHDVFRNFLLRQAGQSLTEDEMRSLNDITGRWYYGKGDYFEGVKYFIRNRDHSGITRCLSQSLHYLMETKHVSVEVRLSYAKQCLNDLPFSFIAENVYLIIWCTSAAFHDGDTVNFFMYLDILYKRFDEIVSKHPNLLQMLIFVFTLDYRVPMIEQCRNIAGKAPVHANNTPGQPFDTRISSITQNLPYFHRSMRDHSEFFRLEPDQLELVASTYGIALGKEYEILQPSFIAGILYERGEMIDALSYALKGYKACTDDMHPEIRFCCHMIPAAIFRAVGAQQESDIILNRMLEYIENKARFLMLNFKALQTIWAVYGGDKEAAREWLDVNAYRSPGPLPFYMITRHFATLHSYIILEDNGNAVRFGQRLQTLADDYRRPLDQIGTRLLIAIALHRSGEAGRSMDSLLQAVEIAMPYGFKQAFVNTGRQILPMLRELKKTKGIPGETAEFASQLTDEICSRYAIKNDIIAAPVLSKRQRLMLSHLGSGLSYAEIAKKTGIPRATVKYHLLTAYKRLGVHDGEEAIIRAKESGLL